MGHFKWRTVAIWSLLTTVASLIALVLIASGNQADQLSEVALSVAILAFVAQLMIAIAQHAAASQQAERGEDVRTETKSALDSIRAMSDELARRQSDQLEMMIEHVIYRAVPDASPSGEAEVATPSREELRHRLLSAARHEVGFSKVWPPPPAYVPDAELLRLGTAPSKEEGEDVFRTLRELSGEAAIHFHKWASEAVQRLRETGDPGGWFSRGLAGPANDQLRAAGLLVETEPPAGRVPPSDESCWVTLTDRGVIALRLCHNPWPAWTREIQLSGDS